MKIQEAIKTLDEVIPSPDNKMVDGEHLKIAIAWKTIRNTLLLQQSYDDYDDYNDFMNYLAYKYDI